VTPARPLGRAARSEEHVGGGVIIVVGGLVGSDPNTVEWIT
jgi:hypothetical protein